MIAVLSQFVTLFFRRSLVTPRRNPSRKSRTLNGIENGFDYRPITRSMTKRRDGVCDASLVDGLRDEQEVRREAIRTRCVCVRGGVIPLCGL